MIHLPARVWVRAVGVAALVVLLPMWAATSRASKTRSTAKARSGAVASPQLDSLVQARSQRKWALAESLATRILVRASTDAHPDTLTMAAAHEAIAESHWSRRANAVGDDVALRNALQGVAYFDRLAPASPSRIRLRVIAAGYLVDSQLPDSGLGLLRVAESLPNAGDSLAAEIHFWKGRAFRGSGRPGVMAEIQTAYEMMNRALGPTHMRVVELLAQKGVTATGLGEYDVAREDLGRAREILERNPTANARQLGAIYGDLSTLERNLGNLGESIDYAHRALQLARTTQGDSSLSVGRIRAMLGLRYLLVSDLRAAEREFALCVPLLARHMGAKSFMTVNNQLYLSYVRFTMGDTAGSMAAFDSLRRTMELEPERHLWNLSFCHTLMAQAIDTPGRMSEARQLSKRAYELIPVSQDSRGTARAEALINLFDETDLAPDRALVDSLGLALERLADSTGLRRNSVYRSVSLSRARAETRVGATDAAWTHALANEIQARSRLMADIRALPESRALELSNTFGGALDVLVWLAADAPAGRAEAAWDRLVRWRGVVRDEIARLRPPLAADGAAREAQQAWGAAQRRYARLVVAGFTERDDAVSREAVEAARSAAEEAERVYVIQSGRGAAPPPDSLDLKNVLASLGPTEALVSFAQANIGRGRERVAAFVATGARREPRCIDLGPASELRDVLGRWREQLAASPAASGRKPAAAERECRRAGEIVRQRVWNPVAAAIEGATAVDIVGDGPLLDVPWLALPDGREGYLVDGNIAVRVLEAERDRLRAAPSASAGALLAVGDPDFDAVTGETRLASNEPAMRNALPECFGEGMRFGRLPAARLEVEDLAGLWRASGAGAHTLLAAEATESAVKREAPGNTVLHLATHGVMLLDTCGKAIAGTRGVGGVGSLSDVSPKSSRKAKQKSPPAAKSAAAPAPVASNAWFGRRVLLALAGASQPPSASLDENDGWLTAEEVVTLDLRGLDWVVLSACHSGAAVAWSREGALGMRRAFELAGAHTVIASLWAVEDDATRQWMRELYLARSQGASGAAEAIRRANRQVLESRRKRHLTTHPFYWAGFTATGG